MTEENVVIFEEPATADGRRIGHARLNAPASLNALSLAMVEQLLPRLKQWTTRRRGRIRRSYMAMLFCGSCGDGLR